MQSTITLNRGQAVMPEISNAELAQRLELFEQNLKLEQENQALQAQVEFMQQGQRELHRQYQEKLAANATGNADNAEVEALRTELEEERKHCANYVGLFDEMTAQRNEAVEELKADNLRLALQSEQIDGLNEHVKALQTVSNELRTERDNIQKTCERLTVNLQTETKAHAATKTALRNAEKRVKELNTLQPEKLKKQVAELKKTSKQKQTDIEALRRQNHGLVKDNKNKANTIAQMDVALEKACDDINAQNAPEPIDTINLGALGKWNVYGTRQINCYDVMDVKNNVSMRLHVEDNAVICPEVRTPPQSLQKAIIKRAARYAATEQRIADDQQPLAQGA